MLTVAQVPVLSDNYVWLLHDEASGETVVIDPAVAEPVLAAAQERGWTIGQIWNTHWHPDHVGGNAEIRAATGCVISGPAAEAAKIGTLDRLLEEGDTVCIGAHQAQVMAVPGHTAGHIAYHLPQARMLFAGDTLFAMGCGRLFEGTPAQMFDALQRFAALPAETAVYCAHEYTLANGRFALTVEPDNDALRQRVEQVEAMRAQGRSTIPTSIGAERETNIFLRAQDVAELAVRRTAKDTA